MTKKNKALTEEDETKIWLSRAKDINLKFTALERSVAIAKSRADGLSIYCDGVGSSNSGKSKNAKQDALLKYIAKKQEYEQEYFNLVEAEEEIEKVISLIGDTELETVLKHRYKHYLTIAQTAEIMHYGTTTVKEKTKQAIKIIIDKNLIYQNCDHKSLEVSNDM